MGPSLDLSLISSWLMLCAKQGPKAGSFFLYVLLNDFPVQLSAVCCDVPVIRDLDAHKYLTTNQQMSCSCLIYCLITA